VITPYPRLRAAYFNSGRRILLVVLCASSLALAQSKSPPNVVTLDWNKTIVVSKSTPTLQVVVNPMLRSGAPMHDGAFQALKQLGADYVRYVPWLPYPRLAVAELEPPTKEKTSWDFSLIDPMTKDFLAATEGHSTVMNFSTIPTWLFKTDKPVGYPADPNQVYWDYTQGTELKDPSGGELGDYYARLVSWYTKGGFTDENGKQHTSGFHYSFPIWEVLNEVDFEHKMTPEQYTARYDAIVSAIHKVSPDTKFMGLALADPGADPRYFEYFLNPANHKQGIPLDYISMPAHRPTRTSITGSSPSLTRRTGSSLRSGTSMPSASGFLLKPKPTQTSLESSWPPTVQRLQTGKRIQTPSQTSIGMPLGPSTHTYSLAWRNRELT
jgi:hypothetical protein